LAFVKPQRLSGGIPDPMHKLGQEEIPKLKEKKKTSMNRRERNAIT